MLRYVIGDILESTADAVVNTVNCVGVMGKGLALRFKQKFPDMYLDYVRRCDKGEVSLGHPYFYRAGHRTIVNFPTKGHWKAASRLNDIANGLAELRRELSTTGLLSIAVPPLGCGNGGLEWRDVRPLIERHLGDLAVRVDLFVPENSSEAESAVRIPAPVTQQVLPFV